MEALSSKAVYTESKSEETEVKQERVNQIHNEKNINRIGGSTRDKITKQMESIQNVATVIAITEVIFVLLKTKSV